MTTKSFVQRRVSSSGPFQDSYRCGCDGIFQPHCVVQSGLSQKVRFRSAYSSLARRNIYFTEPRTKRYLYLSPRRKRVKISKKLTRIKLQYYLIIQKLLHVFLSLYTMYSEIYSRFIYNVSLFKYFIMQMSFTINFYYF